MNTKPIENILIEHPDIEEICVLVVPNAEQSRGIVAFVTLKPVSTETEASLLAFCLDRLKTHSEPVSISVLPALPKSPTGAVQRRKLLELVLKKSAA